MKATVIVRTQAIGEKDACHLFEGIAAEIHLCDLVVSTQFANPTPVRILNPTIGQRQGQQRGQQSERVNQRVETSLTDLVGRDILESRRDNTHRCSPPA